MGGGRGMKVFHQGCRDLDTKLDTDETRQCVYPLMLQFQKLILRLTKVNTDGTSPHRPESFNETKILSHCQTLRKSIPDKKNVFVRSSGLDREKKVK